MPGDNQVLLWQSPEWWFWFRLLHIRQTSRWSKATVHRQELRTRRPLSDPQWCRHFLWVLFDCTASFWRVLVRFDPKNLRWGSILRPKSFPNRQIKTQALLSGGLPHLEHNMTLKNADHRLKFWPRPQKQRFLSSRRRFQNVRLHLFALLPKCRRHTLIHQDGLGYIFQRSDFRPLLHPQRRTWRLPAIRRVRWNIWARPDAWRVRPCRRKLRERWVFRL